MAHPAPVLVGAFTVIVLSASVSAAVVRSGDDAATKRVAATTTSSVPPTAAPTTAAPTTAAPTTTAVARPTTTRTTAPRAGTTTRLAPATTAAPAPAPTTTRPTFTRAEATRALCQEIGASVQAVAGGSTLGGGLKLLRAVNTYGDAADPTVVSPARAMLSAGLRGDLDAGAAATQQAAGACARLGYPVQLPIIECLVAPCP